MPKTLVVDDDPDVETLLRGQLSGRQISDGFDFIFARSEAQALQILGSEKDIDIALAVIDSQTISGMELFRHMKGGAPRIPRIALTSTNDLATIRRAMNNGAVDFLVKPIAADDLIATIDKVFRDCEERRKSWRTEAQLAAIRKEIDIAVDIQRRILPTRFPERGDLGLFARMKPAQEMSGDFFDYFEIGPDKLGLVVADVSGKGIPAAFFMAVARTLIRATAMTGAEPGACLEQANVLLCRHDIPGMFVSVFYSILDTATWELAYANGGHLPPYLIYGDEDNGGVETLAGGEGTVLGIQEDLIYQQDTIALEAGDALFYYTDGLTEAFDIDRNQFTDERLIEYLLTNRDLSAHALAENVFAFVDMFTAGAPQSDDITSLVVKRF